jgi:hypothetical protein
MYNSVTLVIHYDNYYQFILWMWLAMPKPMMIMPNYKKDPGNLFLNGAMKVVCSNCLQKIKLQAKKRALFILTWFKQFVSRSYKTGRQSVGLKS